MVALPGDYGALAWLWNGAPLARMAGNAAKRGDNERMPMNTQDYMPAGVIPACLMPFDADLEIDEPAYRNHLRDLAGVQGISAITVNGHAAEVHALTAAEQQRAIEIAAEELNGRLPVIAGVYSDSSREAGRIAGMADEAGADCLLVFPPNSMALGGQMRPEMAFAHFDNIASRTALPLIVFQYPLNGGLGYPLDTLLRLCDRIPAIRAIKDWCNDGALHERHIRELHGLPRPVNVLSTHSAWLLGSLAMGCRGLLSGAGSVAANLHAALWKAVESGDLRQAQVVNDRLYHTVRAFYRDPVLDMHNRMKEALVLLGRLKSARVRPPLQKLGDAEIGWIGQRLADAGITPQTVYKPVE